MTKKTCLAESFKGLRSHKMCSITDLEGLMNRNFFFSVEKMTQQRYGNKVKCKKKKKKKEQIMW